MNDEWLYGKLKKYSGSDIYPFHMPGHKRKTDGILPYGIDITEIEGFDDLHDPSGVLKKEMDAASEFYGTNRTYFSVNGSTAAVLAAVSAAVPYGGKILAARNCHISVHNAIYLRNLRAVFVDNEDLRDRDLKEWKSMPDLNERMHMASGGPVLPGSVQKALDDDPGIRAVIITSPTYDGYVSDIEKIADIVHSKGGILIVDEAHGAHFSMHPYFPVSAVKLGADLVIQSIHKTLPALTQTALLHDVTGRADRESLERFLHIYQTSSPSYVLMASISECMRFLREEREEAFDAFAAELDNFRKRMSGLQKLRLLPDDPGNDKATRDSGTRGYMRHDPSRIVISVKDASITGEDLYKTLLDKYHIQAEAGFDDRVILISSVADTEEGFKRLGDALLKIDGDI